MGKKQPFVIAGVEFPTKKSAEEYIQGIVNRCNAGARVPSANEGFVLELLARHPEYDQKRGVGIAHLTVDMDNVWRTTKHFTIHRVDGSHTDFSWKTCLNGKNVRSEALGAMRRAIGGQIFTFKMAELLKSLVCPFRGIELTKENSHVDHEPPITFANIADSWFAEIGGYEQVKISEPTDAQCAAEMVEEQQKLDWQTHHQSMAKLRLISAIANLSDVK